MRRDGRLRWFSRLRTNNGGVINGVRARDFRVNSKGVEIRKRWGSFWCWCVDYGRRL